MILVLLFTFFGVKIITPNLFIANTPNVNPLFVAKIINTPREIASMPGKFLSNLRNINLFNNQSNIKIDPEVIVKANQVNPPASALFKYVSKGVSAAEDTQTGQKYMKVDAGTKYKVVGEIEVNGVKYPKVEFIE